MSATDQQVFDHIMDVVLRRDDTSALKKSLIDGRFEDIISVITMTDRDIDDLRDSEKKLAPGDCNLIRLFIAFTQFRHLKGNSILDNDAFMAITKAEYDTFRLNHVDEYHRLVAQTNVVTSTVTAPPTLSPPMGTITTAPSVDIEQEGDNDTWHQAFETQPTHTM